MFSKFRSGATQSINTSHHSVPSTQSSFKSALESIKVDDQFFSGINVLKVNQNGKLEPALFTLSKDRFVISVLPRKLERNSSAGSGGMLRPSILRSRIKSNGSMGGDSLDGASSIDTAVLSAASSNIGTDSVNIGSIDRIQSGQNTLKFELARCVWLSWWVYDVNIYHSLVLCSHLM